MEPEWHEKMNVPVGMNAQDAQQATAEKALPEGVPRLKSRWNEKMDFGEFTDKTLRSYY
jgi:hypothetical protein